MKPEQVVIGMALVFLGCATPHGSYRDYFGYSDTPRMQHRAPEQPSAQSSRVEEWTGGSAYAVTPAWAWDDWYAPWHPDPVWYCYPGYLYRYPCWYRWWRHPWYSGWWCYSPWWYPPVVVVVPGRPEPPMRVRRFGPARGGVVSQEVESNVAGGGRSRLQYGGVGSLQNTDRRSEDSRTPAAEQGGGRNRRSESPRQGTGYSSETATAGAQEGAEAGGARSRSRP